MSSNKIAKSVRYALRFLPDEVYIQLNYFAHFKKFANLKNPKTYNEKLNWLKIHDHNPLYKELVDKHAVKEYVEKKLGWGGGYTVPTLGVWDSVDNIDFEQLPSQFVLKCTHDSEGLVICKDKAKLDVSRAKEKLRQCQKQNFYYIGREWPYKHVKPRIIAEQYIEDYVDGELRDYKFFCFNGEPKAMFVASERSKGTTKFDYYDLEFNHLDIMQKYPNAETPRRKPVCFDEMIELAKILSKGFPHVRVDFYEVDGKVFFGELTFYHFSGFMPFRPANWDKIFGDWIVLPPQ